MTTVLAVTQIQVHINSTHSNLLLGTPHDQLHDGDTFTLWLIIVLKQHAQSVVCYSLHHEVISKIKVTAPLLNFVVPKCLSLSELHHRTHP